MRPLGVTLSALIQFLRGALIAMLGLALLVAGGLTSHLVGFASEGNFPQRFLSGVGHFIGLALLFYALIQIIIGIGLLFLQPWARVLCIIFSTLGVLILLPGLLHLHPIAAVFGAINLAVLIYLLLPQTAASFSEKQPASPAAP